MPKLYCYVDETGQDTEGAFFLVVVVLVAGEVRERLREKLLKIEIGSARSEPAGPRTASRYA